MLLTDAVSIGSISTIRPCRPSPSALWRGAVLSGVGALGQDLTGRILSERRADIGDQMIRDAAGLGDRVSAPLPLFVVIQQHRDSAALVCFSAALTAHMALRPVPL